jgi:hypothetical protein
MTSRSEHDKRYGPAHRRLRAQWAIRVERGEVQCARCGWPIAPGSAWHLDHRDDDPGQYLGASHRKCNTSTWSRLSPQQQARSAFGKGWANVNKRKAAKKAAGTVRPHSRGDW